MQIQHLRCDRILSLQAHVWNLAFISIDLCRELWWSHFRLEWRRGPSLRIKHDSLHSQFQQRCMWFVLKLILQVDIKYLKPGTRITIADSTSIIVRALPRQVDPIIHGMLETASEPIRWSDIGGLNDQIREVREVFGASLGDRSLGHRVISYKARVLCSCWYQTTSWCSALWSPWYWKNVVSKGVSDQHERYIPEGCVHQSCG